MVNSALYYAVPLYNVTATEQVRITGGCMKTERLFNVLVAGGSALAMNICAPPSPSVPAINAPSALPETLDAKLNCDEICFNASAGEGEVICPDPNNSNIENCCWLMSPEKHECCN